MKKYKLILIILVVLLALSGCTRKTESTISGTYYADDEDGKTYIISSGGEIASGENTEMSYEKLEDDTYILHLDKADVIATYDKPNDIVEFRYDGLLVRWYTDYILAEKSRVEKGYEPIISAILPELDPAEARRLEEAAKKILEEEEAQKVAEEEAQRLAEEEAQRLAEEEKRLEEEARIKEEELAKQEAELNHLKEVIIGSWVNGTTTITFTKDSKCSVKVGETTTEYTYDFHNKTIILKDVKNVETIYVPTLKDDKTLIINVDGKETEYKKG